MFCLFDNKMTEIIKFILHVLRVGRCVSSAYLACNNLLTITQLDSLNVTTTLRIIVNILVHGDFPSNTHCPKCCVLESDLITF